MKKLAPFLMATVAFCPSCTEEPATPSYSEPQEEGPLHVAYNGSALRIATLSSAGRQIVFEFDYCMANNLYTFSRIGFADAPDHKPDVTLYKTSQWVNITNSDNIGPYNISKGGWTGGNHLYNNIKDGPKTARTERVEITADSTTVTKAVALYANQVTIRVTNTIFDPTVEPAPGAASLTEPLLTETMEYTVSGNSIIVTNSQMWLNEHEITLSRYYGMQSMFVGETQLYTASGAYNRWLDISKELTFYTKDYPDFCRIVERRPDSVAQSTWLLPDGLGNHGQADGNSPMFVRSSSKSYHVLTDGYPRHKDDEYGWRGIYSWHEPASVLADTPALYVYPVHTSLETYICVDALDATDSLVALPESLAAESWTIHELKGDIEVTTPTPGTLRIRAQPPSHAILLFSKE